MNLLCYSKNGKADYILLCVGKWMTLSDTIYMSNVSLKQRIIDLLMVQKKKKKAHNIKKKKILQLIKVKNLMKGQINFKFIAL